MFGYKGDAGKEQSALLVARRGCLFEEFREECERSIPWGVDLKLCI